MCQLSCFYLFFCLCSDFYLIKCLLRLLVRGIQLSTKFRKLVTLLSEFSAAVQPRGWRGGDNPLDFRCTNFVSHTPSPFLI